MRCMLSLLLWTLARSTAAFASHSEAMASAADRRSRACSVSTSFWCIRSVMLSDEEYSA